MTAQNWGLVSAAFLKIRFPYLSTLHQAERWETVQTVEVDHAGPMMWNKNKNQTNRAAGWTCGFLGSGFGCPLNHYPTFSGF